MSRSIIMKNEFVVILDLGRRAYPVIFFNSIAGPKFNNLPFGFIKKVETLSVYFIQELNMLIVRIIITLDSEQKYNFHRV